MLTSVRTMLTYTVQVQTVYGWEPYIHTDDMEEALIEMEALVVVEGAASRIIENHEEGNILQESYPTGYSEEPLDKFDFDWRKDGF